MMGHKYKIGDKARIRDKQLEGKEYVDKEITKYKGKIAIICGVNASYETTPYTIDLDGGKFLWRESDFEEVSKYKATLNPITENCHGCKSKGIYMCTSPNTCDSTHIQEGIQVSSPLQKLQSNQRSKDIRSELVTTSIELYSSLEDAIVLALRAIVGSISVDANLSAINFTRGTAVKSIGTGVLESSLIVPTITISSVFEESWGVRHSSVTLDILAIEDVTISYQLGILTSSGLTDEGAVQVAQVISDMTQQVVELLDSEEEDTLYALTPIGYSEAKSLYLA